MPEFSINPPPYEWQCPPAGVQEAIRIGWLNESTEQGIAWFKSQRPSADIARALDVIAGRDTGYTTTASYRSRLNSNRLKRNCREVIGALAKLRPMWGYHSDNAAYKEQAEMMNKVTLAWYLESFADRKVKEALQYASTTGRGWLLPAFRRNMYGQGQGDITCLTYGAPSVLPVQLPSSADWQSAYVITVLDEMPVAMAHGIYPQHQHVLQPKTSRYWYSDDNIRRSSLGNFGNIIQRIFGKGPRASVDPQLADLLVPIRRTYIIDLTVNTTDRVIPMGEPGSSWYYEVPFVGQDLGGRKADASDARLYPTRRLIISSENCIMYDGPNFDWHGMFPGVSFAVDEWPWEPLGFSLVHDGFEISEGMKEIERGNMDKIRSRLRPSMAYDFNAVATKEANDFDPFMPDKRIGFDGQAVEGQPFHPILPPEMTKVEAEDIQFYELLRQALDSQLGINDVAALAKLRAVGSMNELEKIMESVGPIIEDISRSMEPPMRDLGVMIKYDILQYYTTPRIMQWVGPDGVHAQVFDYDPASIVPSHLHGEDVSKASPTSKIRRARTFADNVRFFILPNSLHEMQQMVMKLGLIQLRKAGVMIDSQTIAEAWNVPSYGKIDGSTVIERWQNEQLMQLEQMLHLQQAAQALGLQPPGGAGGPPGAARPGKNPEGRPPSGQAPPALKQKEGGARSTVTESR